MTFSFEIIVAVALGLAVVFVIVGALLKKSPRKLQTKYFSDQWQELQRLCGNKDTWPLAILNADKLVDEALIRRKYSGKTMGERLVSAQRVLSDNDSIWYAHKLRNKVAHQNGYKIKQSDVRQSLVGFRQALKDLGAL